MMNGKSAKTWDALSVAALALILIVCGDANSSGDSSAQGNDDAITLEFARWWEPELPDNSLHGLMDEFEKDSLGIKTRLLSGPYASACEQTIASAAAGTMSDVVGPDGAWVNGFAKQDAITDLPGVMKKASYDDSKLVSQMEADDKTYSIPITNFVYPISVNQEILDKAGTKEVSKARGELAEIAKAVTNDNVKGWALPLSLEAPNSIQNDVMSRAWASGGSVLEDGEPFLEGNKNIEDVVTYIKKLWDDQVIIPDTLTMKKQDKVEEFINGRVAMMVGSLVHMSLVRKGNPSLKFDSSPLSVKTSYDGKRGMPFVSWGTGVPANTKRLKQARRLVEFLLSKDINTKLCDATNALPGDEDVKPSLTKEGEILAEAFKI